MCCQTYQRSFLTLWVVFTLLMVSFDEQKFLIFNIVQFISFFLWLALFCVLFKKSSATPTSQRFSLFSLERFIVWHFTFKSSMRCDQDLFSASLFQCHLCHVREPTCGVSVKGVKSTCGGYFWTLSCSINLFLFLFANNTLPLIISLQ